MDKQQPHANAKEVKKTTKEVESLAKKAEKMAKSGKCAEAAEVYQEAARLAESVNDKRAVDFCLEEVQCNLKLGKDFNTGWAYKSAAFYSFSFNDFNNTMNFATKAIDYFTRAGSLYAVQWCYNLMGQAAEKMNDYNLAIKNYRKSLDIEYSEEIEKRIHDIARIAPHLSISHTCESDVVKEGEKVKVTLALRNDTKETLSDIRILGVKANVLESVASMKPGESRALSYMVTSSENVKPFYSKVEWKNARGERMESEIEPPRMCVIPNIDVRPYLRERLEVGKKSYFVVSVANNSRQPISDVNLVMNFPVEIKVDPVSGYEIEKINPGEEKGFVFKILPMVTGKTMLKPAISFHDLRGRNFIKDIEPFVLEESLQTARTAASNGQTSKENMDKLNYTQKFRRFLQNFIHPKEISEHEFVKMKADLQSTIKGYTLKGTDIKTVSSHVLEECRDFAAVASHEFDNERLYLFSGESSDGDTYLLTCVLREDDSLVHVAFKLYSSKDEELENLSEKIADIVKYTVIAMSLATEIQKIEVSETINIIDSIVQRSKIGEKIRKKDKNVDIKDSIVQRTDL
ncbi:MAG: hypothetical protein V1648_03945 [Candidatus Aenigmatarchaeota archaeon]